MRRLLLAWLLGWLTLSGCRQADSCAPPEAVDPTLLAFLSRSRAAHRLADTRQDLGDLPEASAALEDLLKGPVPQAARPGPEVREVLSDTQARLALLRAKLKDFEGAQAALKAGMELAPKDTYFEGQLLEVEGLVEEQRAARLEAEGQHEAARASKKRAVDSLERAMRVQARVIEKGPQLRPGPGQR
jgi:tetratricopeptide (TPR) repeat protein